MNPQTDDALTRLELLDRVVAQQKVRPPGVALMVVGVLWAASGVAFLVLGLVVFAMTREPRAGIGWGAGIFLLAVAAVIGPLVIAIGVATANGGNHLLHLRSHRRAAGGAVWAVTFGILSCGLLLFGWGFFLLLAPFVAGIPVGIWAWIVISDPIVKAAFSLHDYE